jgi:hypothetical protein
VNVYSQESESQPDGPESVEVWIGYDHATGQSVHTHVHSNGHIEIISEETISDRKAKRRRFSKNYLDLRRRLRKRGGDIFRRHRKSATDVH